MKSSVGIPTCTIMLYSTTAYSGHGNRLFTSAVHSLRLTGSRSRRSLCPLSADGSLTGSVTLCASFPYVAMVTDFLVVCVGLCFDPRLVVTVSIDCKRTIRAPSNSRLVNMWCGECRASEKKLYLRYRGKCSTTKAIRQILKFPDSRLIIIFIQHSIPSDCGRTKC